MIQVVVLPPSRRLKHPWFTEEPLPLDPHLMPRFPAAYDDNEGDAETTANRALVATAALEHVQREALTPGDDHHDSDSVDSSDELAAADDEMNAELSGLFEHQADGSGGDDGGDDDDDDDDDDEHDEHDEYDNDVDDVYGTGSSMTAADEANAIYIPNTPTLRAMYSSGMNQSTNDRKRKRNLATSNPI